MKPPPFEYHAVDSVDGALALLAEHGDEAKVLAGGQSLMPLLNLRLARPSQVVDVNRVSDLTMLGHVNGEGLRLGALVRQRTAELSDVVRRTQPLLAEALGLIGHVAIRNRGTVGGSVAHADPAAELPMVMVALGGEVVARSQRGTRTISAAEFFQGFFTTELAADELLTEVRVPSWPSGMGWSIQEFSRRCGDFALVGVAATLQVDGAGAVSGGSLTFSGVGSTPVSSRLDAFVGEAPKDDLLKVAAHRAAQALEPSSDLHGSAAYRRHVAAGLAERALREARQRMDVTS